MTDKQNNRWTIRRTADAIGWFAVMAASVAAFVAVMEGWQPSATLVDCCAFGGIAVGAAANFLLVKSGVL
jgi:hypothetical protein